MNVKLSINTQFLKVTQLECKDILFQHTMQNISFACGGDTDIKDFIAYGNLKKNKKIILYTIVNYT